MNSSHFMNTFQSQNVAPTERLAYVIHYLGTHPNLFHAQFITYRYTTSL